MKFRQVMGLVLIAAGICAGLYFGLWWAFIGGIIQVIEQVRAPELEAMIVAIGVAKVLFAGIIGWASGFLCCIPGLAMLK